MRFAGRIEPARGVGGSGHLAAIFRPKLTVDAKARESCFFRPAIRLGVSVSGPGATAGTGVAVATGFFAPESTGGGPPPGVVSCPAHAARRRRRNGERFMLSSRA